MSRRYRIILIVAAVLLVLLVIVPFLIPVNQFKPTIEAKASVALGRQVHLGNLSLSLLSGSLGAENLVVDDDPRFSRTPFLTAKKMNVGVEIMPLIFSRALNITGVTIKNPQVTLLHNANGQWNYSSLGGAAAKSQPPQNNSSDLSIQKLSLEDGAIVVGFAGDTKRNTYDHVSVKASNISSRQKFPLTVTADLPGGGKFKLDGNVGPMDQADASLTPLDAKITITSLNLASTGFLAPGTGLGGTVDLEANLTSTAGNAETKGNATLSHALFVSGGSPASAPLLVDFDTRYELSKQNGILIPSTVKIGAAAMQLSGTFNNAGESTAINIKIDGRNMPARDLEAFLPAIGIHLPKGASIQGGTLSTNLNLVGPTTNLVTSGNAGIFNVKLSGFDLGSKMSGVSALTGLKTGKDLEIEKLTTDLRMTRDGLRADNFVAVIPALGNIAGAGAIDSKNNLDFKMAATLKNGLIAANPASLATGAIGQIMGGGSSAGCKNGVTVPFLIQGTTADPKFIPDVGGIAAGMLKSQVGCAGSVAGAAKTKPAEAIGSLGGLFKKRKP